MTIAGATPKLTASARESSSAPKREPVRVKRARPPSKVSRMPANTMNQAAHSYAPRDAITMANTPKKTLPRVKVEGMMMTPLWNRLRRARLRIMRSLEDEGAGCAPPRRVPGLGLRLRSRRHPKLGPLYSASGTPTRRWKMSR